MTAKLSPQIRAFREAQRSAERRGRELAKAAAKQAKADQRAASKELKALLKVFKSKKQTPPRRGPLAYQLRKLQGRAKGLTTAQARGHKTNEYAARKASAVKRFGTSSLTRAKIVAQFYRDHKNQIARDWAKDASRSDVAKANAIFAEQRAGLIARGFRHNKSLDEYLQTWDELDFDDDEIPVQVAYYNDEA